MVRFNSKKQKQKQVIRLFVSGITRVSRVTKVLEQYVAITEVSQQNQFEASLAIAVVFSPSFVDTYVNSQRRGDRPVAVSWDAGL